MNTPSPISEAANSKVFAHFQLKGYSGHLAGLEHRMWACRTLVSAPSLPQTRSAAIEAEDAGDRAR